MKRLLSRIFFLTLICSAALFSACSSDDAPAVPVDPPSARDVLAATLKKDAAVLADQLDFSAIEATSDATRQLLSLMGRGRYFMRDMQTAMVMITARNISERKLAYGLRVVFDEKANYRIGTTGGSLEFIFPATIGDYPKTLYKLTFASNKNWDAVPELFNLTLSGMFGDRERVLSKSSANIVMASDYAGMAAIALGAFAFDGRMDFFTPDDPDLWQLYVLRRLVNNNFAAKPNIRCTIDIRRMQVLDSYLDNDREWNSNDEEWLKGTIALAESYTKKVKFSTLFYSMAAGKIEDNLSDMPDEKAANLQRQAHQICVAAQKKWPKSEGALECLAIMADIERKTVTFQAPDEFLPRERNIARVDFRNISTVYIKVVEVPGRLTGLDQVSMLSQLNQCNAVSEWSMHVNDPGDYLEHTTIMNIPPVMQGCYYLMVSTGPYFSSGDYISYRYIECNGIKLVRHIHNNGTLYGVAVDTRTGKPVPDCKYTLWRLNSYDEMVQIATSGITGSDGVILLENYNNGRFKLELESGASRGNSSFYLPRSTDMPDSHRYLQLYTDRYTYLPGDSVQFNGLLFSRTGDKAAVQAGESVTVYALSNRGEELVGTYTTDEMGVFC